MEIMEDIRRSVTYHPSVWGDFFLAYNSLKISAAEEEEHQRHKEEVKKKLIKVTTDIESTNELLQLVDAMQRLGVEYHFEKEIENALKYVYEAYHHVETNKGEEDCDVNDLYYVALRFRLLRQQGYNVSSDIFSKFTDEEGKFKESLTNNIQGLLSLYEASHLRVHDEVILEKAFEFSKSRLQSMMVNDTNKSLASQVNDAMKFPIRKSLTKLTAKNFMSVYKQDESHNEALLKFAKVDFNLVQKLYQRELSDMTRWWSSLDYKNKLPFARDRIAECYFWAWAVYFEPQFKFGRKILAKVLMLTSTMDDVYDVYGSLNDLKHLTDAFQRWDINATEQLPPYMKTIYNSYLDVYEEMKESEGSRKTNGPHFFKEEMKKLLWSYLEEAKWSYNNDIPTMEEYMNVGLVSSAYIMLPITSLVGMESLVEKKDFEWVSSVPLIIHALTIICRLMDDTAGHGFEKKCSAVDCYMKRYNATVEEACDELRKQVSRAWKDINQECLFQTSASTSMILTRLLNFARMIHLLYQIEDRYTHSEIEFRKLINLVFVEPVIV